MPYFKTIAYIWLWLFLEGMRFTLCWCLLFGCLGYIKAQHSVRIDATVHPDLRTVKVSQQIEYTNTLEQPLKQIRLLNWIAAYRNEGTSLAKRKIEDREKALYFAGGEKLGYLSELLVEGTPLEIDLNEERLDIPLQNSLSPGARTTLSLSYTLTLPSAEFTGYGYTEHGAHLKYFFLTPDAFFSPEERAATDNYSRTYKDTEETQSGGAAWDISLDLPAGFVAESNLVRSGERFQGLLREDPEIIIGHGPFTTLSVETGKGPTDVVFSYALPTEELSTLSMLAPIHLNFVANRLGLYSPKLLISEKFRKKEEFFGNDDIKFWKFKFQMFSDSEKTDMDYFSILSKKVINQGLITEKAPNHWLKNGLKTYLEMQYLKTYYPKAGLIGDLPQQASLFGIRPLKYLTVSRLKLTERYGLAYQYIMNQNLDQKIATPFPVLSNFNDMAISHFQMGSLFNYIAEKMGPETFELYVRSYLKDHSLEKIDAGDFLDRLSIASQYSSDFLQTHLFEENRLNFNLKKYRKTDEGYLVKIFKNTEYGIPLKITSEDSEGKTSAFWYDTHDGRHSGEYLIPKEDVRKIQLNDGYLFPESNYRDNYLYTKGLFSNTKKIRLKLLKDIPDPEYNEIYISPKLNFNDYDKVQLGMTLQNKSLFEQNFLYSISPYYSTGPGKFTGSASASYAFRPVDAFFRTLQIGASGSTFHYDKDLTYKKLSLSSSLNFSKVLRSEINRSLYFSYSHFEKDLTPEMVQNNEYDKYGLWNLGYGYVDSKMIHEISFGANYQMMHDFQKLSVEGSYRYEYAENKKIALRLFAGTFFKNNTRNDLFDFGVSRVSNYAFSYNLLGQSATEGILSQQYVPAEGGFKSHVGSSVDKWIVSTNLDAHVWKMFNIYADAGVFQNRDTRAAFIWDSGVKLKLIPDFLEIYFPVQSSLGFEPSLDDYSKRIRYTLNLNFGALINHFRRGWF